MNIREQLQQKISAMTEQEVDARLEELSQTFTPQGFDVLPALDRNVSLLEFKKSALNMIEALKIFIESGYDEEVGKQLGYSDIITY